MLIPANTPMLISRAHPFDAEVDWYFLYPLDEPGVKALRDAMATAALGFANVEHLTAQEFAYPVGLWLEAEPLEALISDGYVLGDHEGSVISFPVDLPDEALADSEYDRLTVTKAGSVYFTADCCDASLATTWWDAEQVLAALDGDAKAIAMVGPQFTPGQQIANANLMAAAPLMYDALKLVQFNDYGFCRECGGSAITGHTVESPVGPACPVGYALATADGHA